MAVQPGLCRTWSETPKTGFLTTRLKYTKGRTLSVADKSGKLLVNRVNNDQDKELSKFCRKNKLISLQRGVPTFFHVNEKDSAEIDYIFLNEKAKVLSSTVRVESYTDSNVSDHIPVYIILKIRTAKKKLKPVTVKLKPKWDKCDKTAYEEFISRQLNPLHAPQSDLEF